MSFETITIYRDIPVIDGYVQAPPNLDRNKTRMTADELYSSAPGVFTRVRLTGRGAGQAPGTGVGQQEMVRLPGIHPNEWYDGDPVAQYLDQDM